MEALFFSDTYYMKEALKEAQYAFQKDEVPIGAVVVCKNRIIARAHNLTQQLHDATAHAEMQALTAASNFLNGKYLNECTLFVTLEPCVMCAGASLWTQIGRIVYGAPDPKRGFSLVASSLLHPKTEVTGNILAAECGELITLFFEKKRPQKTSI